MLRYLPAEDRDAEQDLEPVYLNQLEWGWGGGPDPGKLVKPSDMALKKYLRIMSQSCQKL